MTCYIHADLDAFYASVEQLDHPEYRGKPVIVGGLPDDRRSVVSTASYEARKFGVHSAMPIVQAYKLCPGGIYLRGRMDRYREKSGEIMAIFGDFSPDVEQLSIDEAFIDITGTEGLFGPPADAARKLKERVRNETGLTVSAGLASNKYVAKIASGMSKPDGLFSVISEEEKFMRSLPVGKIWGAGGKTQELFKKYGLKTCEDIYRLSAEILTSMFGNAFGAFLYRAVRGEPAETFERESSSSRSMSAERTFEYDLYDEFVIETALLSICETLMFRLLSCRVQSATVSLKIRYGDFSTEGIQETFQTPVLTLNDFYKRVLDLFHRKYQKGRGIRLIGAAFMNLETGKSARQGDLFDQENDRERSSRERRLEESILSINAKYPGAALRRSRSTIAPSRFELS